MGKSSKAGGKAIKASRVRKSGSAQGEIGAKPTAKTNSSNANQAELKRLTRERDKALEQQAATAEVIKAINSSAGDLTAVFDSILLNAARICEASLANLLVVEGSDIKMAAMHAAPETFAKSMRDHPVAPASGPAGVVIATKRLIHIADVSSEARYKGTRVAKLAGARTLLGVPLLMQGEAIGAILLYRQEVRLFSNSQIALLESFAAQAVIAIENTRLLNDLRQRTDDLSESLKQQTASSEVLKAISSSPGNLEPVFDAMLENALRICEAKFGVMFRFDNDGLSYAVATRNLPSAAHDYFNSRGKLKPSPGSSLDVLYRSKQIVHTVDMAMSANPSRMAKLANVRTEINIPMLKDDAVVGAICIFRTEVRPFSEKQIELMQTFAAQAVIAIENTRLLNELRESLQQQMATADILTAISVSQSQLNPVFDTIVDRTTRICGATFACLGLFEGGALRFVAISGASAASDFFHSERLHQPNGCPYVVPLARVKSTMQTPDVRAERGYAERDPFYVIAADVGGARTVLRVPLLKGDLLLGHLWAFRAEVLPFTDKQTALLQNFAAQAVIAMENARLLNDLNTLNQQLEQRVTEQVDEIERMARLRRFLPPQVADLIVSSGAEKQLESHRREITALFCDLRGFTGFSESSDPEDVMALLRDYHAAIGQIIVKYRGTLERYAGDGVMVVFNDPVPVENPALQAVLTALEMREAITALTETWRRWGHDIGFGIGIAHGFATLGTIGFEGRFDYAAIGTVSNVASRLCDEAKPGQILVSPRVLTQVENAVKIEPVGEFVLKGIRRPMMAYNVLDASPSKLN